MNNYLIWNDYKTMNETFQMSLKVRKLVRVGKCINCGQCCYHMLFNLSPFKIKKLKVRKCGDYDEVNKKCKNHFKKGYPASCKLFPFLPETLPKGCGYSFKELK